MDLSNGDGWLWRIDVNQWINGLKDISTYGIKDAQIGGTPYDTVKKIKTEFALGIIQQIGF